MVVLSTINIMKNTYKRYLRIILIGSYRMIIQVSYYIFIEFVSIFEALFCLQYRMIMYFSWDHGIILVSDVFILTELGVILKNMLLFRTKKKAQKKLKFVPATYFS